VGCFVYEGSKINWVQCDGCELWYHLVCVGLTPSQVADDSYEYHCDDCHNTQTSSQKSTTIFEASSIASVSSSLTVNELLLRASTVASSVETVGLSPIALSSNCEQSALDLTVKTLSALPAQADLNLPAQSVVRTGLTQSAQPVTRANFLMSAQPVAGAASIRNLQPVFSSVLQQRPIGVVQSFAQPSFGLLTSVSQQFGSVGCIKPLDYRSPITAALTNTSQGAERTVANTLAAMPGNALMTRPSLSFGQYLYGPWINNNAPR